MASVPGEVGGKSPPLPATLSEDLLRLGRLPGCRQNQEERQVRRGVVKDPGGVAHGDAERIGGGHVNVVVPHRSVGHGTEPACAPRFEDRRINPVGQVAHHAVELGDEVDQFVVRRCDVSFRKDDVVSGPDEGIGSALNEAAGDEDAAHQVAVS